MKNKILILIGIMIFSSCQNKQEKKNIIKTIVQDTLSKTLGGTADVSDALLKDDNEVELIRKQVQFLLKKDLQAMTKEDRYFYYEAFDLNNDKKNEYFVGFSNSYFCGSGGCSGYILNNDRSLINNFTVTNFPILMMPTSSEKFQDLIFESGNKYHLLKMENGKYPTNPSLQEVWKRNIPDYAIKVLDIKGKKLVKYSF